VPGKAVEIKIWRAMEFSNFVSIENFFRKSEKNFSNEVKAYPEQPKIFYLPAMDGRDIPAPPDSDRAK